MMLAALTEQFYSLANLSLQPQAIAIVFQVIAIWLFTTYQLLIDIDSLFQFALTSQRPCQHTAHGIVVWLFVVQSEERFQCLLVTLQLDQTDGNIQLIVGLLWIDCRQLIKPRQRLFVASLVIELASLPQHGSLMLRVQLQGMVIVVYPEVILHVTIGLSKGFQQVGGSIVHLVFLQLSYDLCLALLYRSVCQQFQQEESTASHLIIFPVKRIIQLFTMGIQTEEAVEIHQIDATLIGWRLLNGLAQLFCRELSTLQHLTNLQG